MKAVGYVRVSTASQSREGASLQAQRDLIQKWTKLHGYVLLAIEEDSGFSGSRADNREGLRKAIELVCEEKAAIVVYSLSRLSRSTRDTLTVADRLDRAGADLVSLSERIDTTTAAGKMVFRMLAVLNEFERDQVSERTSAILQHKKARLEAYSPTPYGYSRDGKKLVEDEEEQAVIESIRGLRSQGESLRKIARELNEVGVCAKNGGRWYASTIRYILINTLYA